MFIVAVVLVFVFVVVFVFMCVCSFVFGFVVVFMFVVVVVVVFVVVLVFVFVWVIAIVFVCAVDFVVLHIWQIHPCVSVPPCGNFNRCDLDLKAMESPSGCGSPTNALPPGFNLWHLGRRTYANDFSSTAPGIEVVGQRLVYQRLETVLPPPAR